MTKNEIDRLLLKHVFGEDIDKPPKWYYENFWLQTLLCNSWPGLGLLVEKMRKKGWTLTLQESDGAYESEFESLERWSNFKDYSAVGRHTEAPMAVALAALRAVGVEIPEEEVPK